MSTPAPEVALHVPAFATWEAVLAASTVLAPSAFDGNRLRNLHEGRWQATGTPSPVTSPVDGTVLVQLPKLDSQVALSGVHAAALEHAEWAEVPLGERSARVAAEVEAMSAAHAVTLGVPMEELYGNFPGHHRYPAVGGGSS